MDQQQPSETGATEPVARSAAEAAGDAREESAGESRSRHLMVITLAWGVLTLVLLWWFERSYRR